MISLEHLLVARRFFVISVHAKTYWSSSLIFVNENLQRCECGLSTRQKQPIWMMLNYLYLYLAGTGVTACCVHPGAVFTNLWRQPLADIPPCLQSVVNFFMRFCYIWHLSVIRYRILARWIEAQTRGLCEVSNWKHRRCLSHWFLFISLLKFPPGSLFAWRFTTLKKCVASDNSSHF